MFFSILDLEVSVASIPRLLPFVSVTYFLLYCIFISKAFLCTTMLTGIESDESLSFQFLDLCTYKLGLAQAARKLFMMSGEVVTDMSQLLQPYYPELCLPLNRSNFQEIKVSDYTSKLFQLCE